MHDHCSTYEQCTNRFGAMPQTNVEPFMSGQCTLYEPRLSQFWAMCGPMLQPATHGQWAIDEQWLRHAWATHELLMNHVWTVDEPAWAIRAPFVYNTGYMDEPCMDGHCTIYAQIMIHAWSIHEPLLKHVRPAQKSFYDQSMNTFGSPHAPWLHHVG